MREEIKNIELLIYKAEASGKYPEGDWRVTGLEQDVEGMRKALSRLLALTGERAYKFEHPSLDKYHED